MGGRLCKPHPSRSSAGHFKAGACKGKGKGSDDEGKGGCAAAAAGAAEGKGHAKGTLQEAIHFKVASEADLSMPSQVRHWLAERAELWPQVKFCQDIAKQADRWRHGANRCRGTCLLPACRA